MPFRGKRSRRPTIVRKSRKARSSNRLRKPIAMAIKRAIARNIENKVYSKYATNVPIVTTSLTTPTYLGNLLPQITNGTNNTERIGNHIRIKHAYIRGVVNLLPYSVLTNPLSTPVIVKMWLASTKQINTNDLALTACSTNFFDAGASPAGFQGNVLDTLLSPNKDAWVIHATKTVELGATYASATGAVGTSGYFDNSKMTMPFYFSYGKKFRGEIKYNDATTIPTNRNLFLIFQAVYADGSFLGTQIAEYHYTCRVEYEDA